MTDIQWLATKGERNLVVARNLFEDGFYDVAVSRAYYAMFYLASAALLTRRLEYRRHGQLVAAFGHHLAAPGILPAHLHESLTEALELRLRSDYRAQEEVSAEIAAEILGEAEEFVEAVKAFLEKESQT